jgi:plastocyanin
MKIKYLTMLLVIWIIGLASYYPQTVHNVSVTNFSFTPAQLTINAGDIVRWTNNAGTHNVVADDNSFTSGPVSSSAWVYEFTFNVPGTNPYYCQLHGGPGGSGMSGVIFVEEATDINDENMALNSFELKQNFPNPFNPKTKIKFTIPADQKNGMSKVVLKVFDVLGNNISTLLDEEKPAGSYEIEFDASELSSGIYFYKLQAGNFIDTKKMILMK